MSTPIEALLESNDELSHYGVKGMRWGKRKQRDSGSSSSSAPKPASPKQAKAAAKTAYKAEKKAYNDTRKELSAKVKGRSKEEKKQRDEEHVTKMLEEASKPNSKILIQMTPAPTAFDTGPKFPVVYTGPEFIKQVSKQRGYIDAVSTQVWANEPGGYSNQRHREALDDADGQRMGEAINKLADARAAYKGKG